MNRLERLKSMFALSVGLLLGGLLMIGESAGATSGPTQTNSGAGVTVEVTYINPNGTEDARFQVALNTHSVDLDGYDLKSLSLLREETGKAYQPTKVENKGSGHHRQIVIVFPKASPQAKRLELVINDIAGVKERSFRWDLSK